MKRLSIKDIRVILTAPMNRNLVVVKVITEEPAIYGIGCGTFTQRFSGVASILENHLKPLVIGRDSLSTEELWRLMSFNGYWRGGPVINNAISAIDMALWDIKAKVAQLPLYQLLGGKVREATTIYRHADGTTIDNLVDNIKEHISNGIRHVRPRLGQDSQKAYSSSETGGMAYGGTKESDEIIPKNAIQGAYYNPQKYISSTLEAFSHIRSTFGDKIELLHDVHGRLHLSETMYFAKELERFRLFFLEDPLSLEDFSGYKQLKAHSIVPIAASELFTSPEQWLYLLQKRHIDFLRMHVSDIGGLTPARKAAIVAESFGVRTAWHGPGDCSPVGHAVNLHLNLATPNFGIQEFQPFTKEVEKVFSGCPKVVDGYMYPNDNHGHGVDIDEDEAKKYPCRAEVVQWTQARRTDGSLHSP